MNLHRSKPLHSAVCVLMCAVLALSLTLQIPLSASALTIADQSNNVASAMDEEAYPETVQVPVTLYDYGHLVDGTWITKDPTVLNEGLDCANGKTTSLEDIPRTMRFWDTQYLSWDDASDYSSFVAEDGGCYKGGTIGWGLFESTFTDWSSIIAVDSRDLFGTSEESCWYEGEMFKEVYENVLMDFSYNSETNTYHFCSNESESTFDGENHLVKTEREAGYDENVGFWPFGVGEVHFGLTMDFDFYLPSQTYLDNNEYYFAFCGDDDLVVYVDDVLALDLGGAHGAIAGYIDFANEIVVYGYCDVEEQQACFENSIAESGVEVNYSGFEEAGVDWNMDTYCYVTFEELGIDLETSSEHSFKLAYLERGGDESNLTIEMNMQIQVDVEYEVVGDVYPDDDLTTSVPVEERKFDLYDEYTALAGLETTDEGYYFKGWYSDSDCTELWEDGTMLTSAYTVLYGRWVYAEAIKTSDPETGTAVEVGDTIVYTVTYTNTDSADQKVTISDCIPSYTTLVDESVVCEGGASDLTDLVSGKGSVSATWDVVEPGETVVLEFSVTVDEDAYDETVVNQGTVDIDDGAIVIATNETEHPVDPEVVEDEDDPTDPDDPEEEEDEEADEEESSTLPETGDPVVIGVLAAILACVVAGIALLVKTMRRRSE